MSNLLNDLMHPVRMRIIQALMPNQNLAVQELEEILDDVAPATLYRHVNKLLEANMIEVVDEEQIRGTVKKRYALAFNNIQDTQDSFTELTEEELMKYFAMFTGFLQSEFQRYLSNPNKDLEKDGVGFRYVSVYATDEEFMEWIKQLREVMSKLISNEKTTERTKRTIANIFIPTKE